MLCHHCLSHEARHIGQQDLQGLIMGPDELLDIIRRYDVSIDSSTLRSVLGDEEQGRLLAEWAKSHLTPDTLLTKDELNSYDRFKSSNLPTSGRC